MSVGNYILKPIDDNLPAIHVELAYFLPREGDLISVGELNKEAKMWRVVSVRHAVLLTPPSGKHDWQTDTSTPPVVYVSPIPPVKTFGPVAQYVKVEQ